MALTTRSSEAFLLSLPGRCRRCLVALVLVFVEVKLDLAKEAPCLLFGEDEEFRDDGAGAGSK